MLLTLTCLGIEDEESSSSVLLLLDSLIYPFALTRRIPLTDRLHEYRRTPIEIVWSIKVTVIFRIYSTQI